MEISRWAAARWLIVRWMIAPLFCLWLYWDGLHAWFQADDFAFLGLHRRAVTVASFAKLVFTASPHGAFRPLSERAFFLMCWPWFGLNATAYHAVVFLTQAANLVLLAWIVERLTGSRKAAVFSAVLWTANASLSDVLGWTCAYNEILCVSFLLGAFGLWLKFEETGRRSYYALQAAVFVVGFGVLELNMVYPALAAAWVVLRGRWRMLPWTVPLFAISGMYLVFHAWLVKTPASGPYSMHFDAALPATLVGYWAQTFVISYWKFLPGYAPGLAVAAIAILSVAVLVCTAMEARARNFTPLFFLVWFLVTLAPFLPLRDHRSSYYLAVPSLGIAAVLGMLAVRRRIGWAVAAVYLAAAIPAARAGARFNYERGEAARNLVLGVKRAMELHPGKTLMLTDVSADLYSNVIVHHPFRVFSDTAVYLAPDTRGLPEIDDEFTLPPGPALHALKDERLEVYSAAGPRLRNVTVVYAGLARESLPDDAPRNVDAGDALDSYLLGPGWYPPESGFRWMGKRASVRMGAPRDPQDRLFMKGHCDARSLPLTVAVYVDGVKSPEEVRLTTASEVFEASFGLPAGAVGKKSIQVEVEVDRTFREAAGARELGAAFGNWRIGRP